MTMKLPERAAFFMDRQRREAIKKHHSRNQEKTQQRKTPTHNHPRVLRLHELRPRKSNPSNKVSDIKVYANQTTSIKIQLVA